MSVLTPFSMLRSAPGASSMPLLRPTFRGLHSTARTAPRHVPTPRRHAHASISSPGCFLTSVSRRGYRADPSGLSREQLRFVPSTASSPRSGGGSLWSHDAPPIHSRLKPSIFRPVVFAVTVSGAAYLLAAYATNADTDARLRHVQTRTAAFFSRATSSADLAMSRRTELVESVKGYMRSWLGPQPDVRDFGTRVFTLTGEWWINKSEAQRTCLGLIALQGIVFLGWRVVPGFLAKTFMHYPLSGRSYTMLTSTFSHSSGLHFLFNSLAFYSFGPSAMAHLWQPNRQSGSDMLESTPRYHFLALFVAAGVFSSLTSHVYQLVVALPRVLSGALAGRASAAAILPSHGASGSIYAMVVMTALAFPDSKVSLIFLPFFPISIGTGVAGLVGLDVIGLLSLRFRAALFSRFGVMLDHAGHLGGAVCGYLAWLYAGPLFDKLRRVVGGIKGKPARPPTVGLSAR